MPTFRIISDDEARKLKLRADISVYLAQLRSQAPGAWALAELAPGEKKERAKKLLRRAADQLHQEIEFDRSASDTVIYRIVN